MPVVPEEEENLTREPEPEHVPKQSPPKESKLIEPVKYDPKKEGLELNHP